MLPRELERLSKLRETAFSLPPGVPLELTLHDHRRVHGLFDAATDDAVRLYPGQGQPAGIWMFDEIRAVRRLDRQRFPLLASARRWLAVLLASIMSLAAAQSTDVRVTALALPNDAIVRIRTHQNDTFRGKFIALTEDGVTVRVVEKAQFVERTILFRDIKALKQTNSPSSGGETALLAVLSFFGVILIVGLVAAAVR